MKFVVFTGDLSYSVRKNIVAIDRAVPGSSWLVLLHVPQKTMSQTLRAQWRNLKRDGWRRIPDLAATVRGRFFSRSSEPAEAGSGPGGEYTSAALRARANIKIHQVPDIHAPAVFEQARQFQPDLGLSVAAPILRPSLFQIPRLGTINLHKGKVPEYRGMPPAFWEMWNDEESVGCTVHWVEEKLDTGPVAVATTLERDRYSTLRGMKLSLDEIGIALLRDAVIDLASGAHRAAPQPQGGKAHRKPTLAQEAALSRKLARLQPPGPKWPFQLAKGGVTRAKLAANRGLRSLTTPRATVLLYHRVSDTARDNLTVGIEQFDRHMELLQRHCHVVPLRELIEWLTVPKSKRPLVCVTFDDGYLDNYAHAMPLLERHGIPASFFVSTGIVGTDLRFPHDIQRGNAPIPVMTWDHLREMHAAGFEIGSHTVHHINCAQESEEVTRREISQSLEDLRRELGVQDSIFSYPYGARQDMTPERLEWVKQAGYVACLSAYGGSNVGTVDRFNVVRRGIHWEFSDPALLVQSFGIW